MHKFLFFILLTGSLAFGLSSQPAQDYPQVKNDIGPRVVTHQAPPGWSCEEVPVLRCPAPSFWMDQYGWRVISLKKGNNFAFHLDVPSGRVNDVLIDEKRQLGIISIQLDRANIAIYVVSPKEWKVWAVDQKPLGKVLTDRRPKEDPQNRYAISPFQLVGLRQEGNLVEGLVRHKSAINHEDRHLSLLIRFSLDLDSPQPAAGALWPLTVTKVEDSEQEREWDTNKKDFNPPPLPAK